MKKNNYLSILLFLLLMVINSASTFAQCSMCRATAESDLNTGGSIARGLNMGILYLMIIPYLILMLGTYFFFKKPIDAKIKNLKCKYFPAR